MLRIEDRVIATDNDGYLENFDDWNQSVAAVIANHENIVMTPAHWEVIDALREFYRQFEQSPAMRPLARP